MGLSGFSGAVAVITGGASGIGAAMAQEFASRGATIVLGDVEKGPLDDRVDQLVDQGVQAIGVVCDVRDKKSVDNLASVAFGNFGQVNILCNNAGVGSGAEGKIWDYEANDWTWAIGVNVWGVINGISAFVPKMIESGQEGVVINTSSGNGGIAPLASSPIYAMTKASVTCISECLYAHLVEVGSKVSCSVLYPGPHMLRTGLWTSWRNRPHELAKEKERSSAYPTLDEMEDAMRKAGMDVRFTDPADVARDVVRAIEQDQFWILPDSRDSDLRITLRAESMLKRSPPNYMYSLPNINTERTPDE